MIIGFKYGITVGEHASLDNITVAYSKFAITMLKSGIASRIGKLTLQGNVNHFYFPESALLGLDQSLTVGDSYFTADQINCEVWKSTGIWYDFNTIVSDSSNYGIGSFAYLINQNGVGHTRYTDTMFRKYGGKFVSERSG